MNETMNTEVMEEIEAEVVENESTELATYEETEEADSAASKVAVGAGLATLLVGGFLIGKKLYKKHKAKKAATETEDESEELGQMLEKYAAMQKETLELKQKIDAMIPQSCDNMKTEEK